MGLNIKNKETQRLTRELAELTGESLTGAITAAVRERLERVRRDRGPDLVDSARSAAMIIEANVTLHCIALQYSHS